jgi:hypothetical protein
VCHVCSNLEPAIYDCSCNILFTFVFIHKEVSSAFPYFRNIAAHDSPPAIRTYHLLSVVISGSEHLRSDTKWEESFLKLSFILYWLSFFLRLISSLRIYRTATSIAEGEVQDRKHEYFSSYPRHSGTEINTPENNTPVVDSPASNLLGSSAG